MTVNDTLPKTYLHFKPRFYLFKVVLSGVWSHKKFPQKLINNIKLDVACILPLFKKHEGCVDNE